MIFSFFQAFRQLGLPKVALAVVFLGIGSVGVLAAQEVSVDTLFSYANELKVELKAAGDTSLALRSDLGAELERICEVRASGDDHDLYIKTLLDCENLIRDIKDSYEYLTVLRQSAQTIITTEQKPQIAADIYMALVRIAVRMSDHAGAYMYLDKIAALSQEKLDADTRTKVHFFSGYLAYYAEDFELASKETTTAAKISMDATDVRIKILTHDGASSCLNELGKFEEGLIYANKAVEIEKAYLDTAKNGVAIGNLYLNLAESEYGMGMAKNAFANVEKAIELAIISKHPIAIGNAYCVRGRLKSKERNFSAARKDIKLALDYFNNAGDLYSSNLARKEQIIIEKGAGNLDKALALTDQFHAIRDSLDARQLHVSAQVAKFDREAERARAERELFVETTARQNAEAQQSKLKFRGLGVIILLLLIIIGFVFARLQSKRSIQASLEEEVERRTAQITEQANKLKASNEELERFAYIASHDLKTPLRNVTSFLNLIERRLPTEAKALVTDYLKIASDNARQMHHLVTDVLEFSRINTDLLAESTSFSLKDACDELSLQMKPELDRVSGRMFMQGDVNVFTPKNYLMQVIKNLVENGLKYNESDIPQVTIRMWSEEGAAYVEVRDNGIGIDAEYHEQIFSLFKRLHTTDKYEGTGLGLAVCRKIVTRLGGEITVASAPEGGSVFAIVLPLKMNELSSVSESLELPKKAVSLVA